MSDKPNKSGRFQKAPTNGNALADLHVTDISKPLETLDTHQLEKTLNKLSEIETSTSPIRIDETHTLGYIIRKARKQIKLSQQEFADLTGVGRRFISELERGKPSLEFGLVLQVCEAAGIDILAKRK
ncbi:MAG: helix-turn-helix transcriptional regulator [Parvibaculum sp.]